MRFLGILCWLMMAGMLFPQEKVMDQSLNVLVLDALDAKPQANVKVESLCAGLPQNYRGKSAFTNDKGIATVSYSCNDKQVIEIEVFPPNMKEQCGDDVKCEFQ